jgi:hypothetical protein
MVMPDVHSIRHTTVEDHVESIAHEIKVSRADLRSDLRNEAKRESYRALSSQCWYAIKAGIAQDGAGTGQCRATYRFRLPRRTWE